MASVLGKCAVGVSEQTYNEIKPGDTVGLNSNFAHVRGNVDFINIVPDCGGNIKMLAVEDTAIFITKTPEHAYEEPSGWIFDHIPK